MRHNLNLSNITLAILNTSTNSVEPKTIATRQITTSMTYCKNFSKQETQNKRRKALKDMSMQQDIKLLSKGETPL